MAVLNLDKDEIEYLKDIVDNWIDGMEETAKATEQDRLFDDPEQMLDAVNGVHDLFHRATTIKVKLTEALDEVLDVHGG